MLHVKPCYTTEDLAVDLVFLQQTCSVTQRPAPMERKKGKGEKRAGSACVSASCRCSRTAPGCALLHLPIFLTVHLYHI